MLKLVLLNSILYSSVFSFPKLLPLDGTNDQNKENSSKEQLVLATEDSERENSLKLVNDCIYLNGIMDGLLDEYEMKDCILQVSLRKVEEYYNTNEMQQFLLEDDRESWPSFAECYFPYCQRLRSSAKFWSKVFFQNGY